MRKVAINCNQTKEHGFGHFFRCLSLARHMIATNDYTITFVGEFSIFAKEILETFGLMFEEIYSNEKLKLQIELFDILITDRYDIDQSYLDSLKNHKKTKRVFLDDFNILDFTGQDLVINFRVGIESISYNSISNALGPKYFIYKPELFKIRTNYIFRNEVKAILMFGTATEKNSLAFMNLPKFILFNYKDITVFHLTDSLISFNHDRYKIIRYSSNIEKHFSLADVIINGGGLIKYEAAFCGIPAATLSSTEEQHGDTLILESENLLFNLGSKKDIDSIKIQENLLRFINDDKLRFNLSKTGKEKFKPDSIYNLIKKINEL
jgi:spore coat polysaccharide biosynthesis predicted glycosyltransferase SpsG